MKTKPISYEDIQKCKSLEDFIEDENMEEAN